MIPDAHAGAATTIQYDLLLQEAMLHDGSVVDFGIRDGRIAALRPSLEGPAARTIQLERRVVLPGLVESHTHLDKALTVSHSENHSGTLYEAMSCMHHVHCSATSTQLHARALRAARLFIAAGTTTLRTHADVTPTLGLLGVQVLLAVREALRGLLDLQIVALSCDLTGQEGRRMRELVEEALRLGVDAVGGAPVLDRDPREHIDFVFDLAQRYDRPVDLHIDESDDPRDFCLPYLAEKTMAVGYGGRVLAGHCCSLAAVDAATARATIELVRAAEITIVTLPSANMYLQGRGDQGLVRRGVTRVRELLDAGVPVCCGSDNVQDPFNPFGRGDLLLVANLLAHVAHLGSAAEQTRVLGAITTTPARALGLGGGRLEPGAPADLVVLDTRDPRSLLALVPPRRYVIKCGKIVAETRVEVDLPDFECTAERAVVRS